MCIFVVGVVLFAFFLLGCYMTLLLEFIANMPTSYIIGICEIDAEVLKVTEMSTAIV